MIYCFSFSKRFSFQYRRLAKEPDLKPVDIAGHAREVQEEDTAEVLAAHPVEIEEGRLLF